MIIIALVVIVLFVAVYGTIDIMEQINKLRDNED